VRQLDASDELRTFNINAGTPATFGLPEVQLYGNISLRIALLSRSSSTGRPRAILARSPG
jgi:hypothetical protein